MSFLCLVVFYIMSVSFYFTRKVEAANGLPPYTLLRPAERGLLGVSVLWSGAVGHPPQK